MKRMILLAGLVFGLLLFSTAPADAQYPPDVVASIKDRLNREGYRVGPVDGQWDGRTSEALRQYQYDRQLPATGELNPPTAQSLGISPPGDPRSGPPEPGFDPPDPPPGSPDGPHPPGPPPDRYL